jgi:tetratricopeptide (TPR) repeat protein
MTPPACPPHAHAVRSPHPWVIVGCIATLFFAPAAKASVTPEKARQMMVHGEYAGAIAAAEQAMREKGPDADWPLVRAEALAEVGRYQEGRDILIQAIVRSPDSIQLHLAACEAQRSVGAVEESKKQLAEVNRLGETRPWAYRSPADQVTLARAALLSGKDPKQVLDEILDPVRKVHPEIRDTYLLTGEVALGKSDYALAAKTFEAAAKKFPEDPDVWFGIARAYAPSDPEEAAAAIEKTLKFNPNHVGAQLFVAEQDIDEENYADADAALEKALKVNPRRPEAHASRAVIANLRSDTKLEAAERAEALKPWPKNPAVPNLIGRKLSRKYRFAEGAALQREALAWDPDYLPAKAQLATDLLRLGGHDEEAWKLAAEVQAADPYDIVAYNLTELHDAIAHFRTLTSAHFLVKMDPHEAEIYGADVLALLERAHDTLTKKYGMDLRDRTIVEIFPDQKDFAIRTFGLPGGAGYLGVCFGRVITANSPASRPNSPNSWEAVLWHEFCHVVTLTLTKNKMPRWLSEGISVFEERQARENWGERMKPRYRAMILGADLTPVSQLSAAFLKPKSPAHLGFAYYESSLVVEWLIDRWGLDKMKSLLADLAGGVEINAALAARFEPIDKLDSDFAARAQDIAKNTGPKLDWKPPKPADFADETRLNQFIARNPDNFDALNEQASQLLESKQWAAAKIPLQKLIDLYPDQRNAEGAYAMLARVHRELGESDAEIAMLNKVAELNSNAPDAFERLMQIAAERKDWQGVLDNAARYSGVNPLSLAPHRYEAEAREALGENPAAIAAYRALMDLGPPDPAEIHYRLARLLHDTGDPAAKREVLLALEDAPRFRAALDLLLLIDTPESSNKTP